MQKRVLTSKLDSFMLEYRCDTRATDDIPKIRRVGTRSMSLKSMLPKRCYGQPDLPAAVRERHHVMDDELRP
eukprot:scaffold13015_cov132-Skeletonema_menzelii.AAC.5